MKMKTKMTPTQIRHGKTANILVDESEPVAEKTGNAIKQIKKR
jgi:hypothetical protein